MASDSPSKRLAHWQQRWTDGEHRPWHRSDTNPCLEAHYDNVVLSRENLTFLVPLCGKTLDLLWLYNKGHTVIGIEGIRQPVLEFFAEHGLEHTVQDTGAASIFQTADKRLKIYVGDFFSFTSDVIGKVDCVWDRGSLVAVFKSDRVRYVELMKTFLKPGARYLLQSVEYDFVPIRDASPRSIPVDEVKQLYEGDCKVELLETVKLSPDAFRHLGVATPTQKNVNHCILIVYQP